MVESHGMADLVGGAVSHLDGVGDDLPAHPGGGVVAEIVGEGEAGLEVRSAAAVAVNPCDAQRPRLSDLRPIAVADDLPPGDAIVEDAAVAGGDVDVEWRV